METEVMISSPPSNFYFESTCTTPYMSAPSSPTFFYSAPASPSAAVPFTWEHKPGIPKSHASTAPSSNYGDAEEEEDEEHPLDDDKDFAFDFSGHLERTSLPADELFDGGKIKPLKPPPRFQYRPLVDSPKSPNKRFMLEAFSPKKKHQVNNNDDPFTAALEHTRNDDQEYGNRGRERTINNTRKNSSRSLSPFRVSDLLFDPPETTNQEKSKDTSSSWYKKWKIKDLLLFRSASESRAKEKEEQMKKYSQLKKPRQQEEVRNSSFRSTDSVGSGSSRRAPISAHELHYTVNRAFSEEMRKRTSLPYRQGFLGCLGFHPEISKTPSSRAG